MCGRNSSPAPSSDLLSLTSGAKINDDGVTALYDLYAISVSSFLLVSPNMLNDDCRRITTEEWVEGITLLTPRRKMANGIDLTTVLFPRWMRARLRLVPSRKKRVLGGILTYSSQTSAAYVLFYRRKDSLNNETTADSTAQISSTSESNATNTESDNVATTATTTTTTTTTANNVEMTEADEEDALIAEEVRTPDLKDGSSTELYSLEDGQR